jgi:signal peptidase I
MPAQRKNKFLTFLFDIFELTIISLTIFLVIYLFVGQLLEVTGDSMNPTFYDKEQVLAEKVSKKFKPFERGDIVIFRHPEKNERLLIKRVIAMPFENFKISEGKIFINGELLDEPYLPEDIVTSGGSYFNEGTEYNIPIYTYVLMGDNREKSSDSRVFGPVRDQLIIGRAAAVYYPLRNFRIL